MAIVKMARFAKKQAPRNKAGKLDKKKSIVLHKGCIMPVTEAEKYDAQYSVSGVYYEEVKAKVKAKAEPKAKKK